MLIWDKTLFNQSINQSISQSVSQSINQSINLSINQSINQSSQSISQSIDQSITQPINQPIYQSIIPINQPRIRPDLILKNITKNQLTQFPTFPDVGNIGIVQIRRCGRPLCSSHLRAIYRYRTVTRRVNIWPAGSPTFGADNECHHTDNDDDHHHHAETSCM